MGPCVSKSSEERELAAQVLGSAHARNAQAVRRLSALGTAEGEVWVTRQTSDIRKVFKFGPQINKGQFGTIHVVSNAAGEKFACKTISKRKLTGPNSIRDIRREIEIMHHLRGHPNVITFHGAYEDANDVYLVMELCTGGDLFERMESASTITERSAAALFRDLVETVSYCHTLGVLHRDLKPENFLVTDHSPDARIKLADFGLSVFFAEGQAFKDVVGSAYYMAPEVIRRQYGKACDVWSLGVILHILLSGSPPFTGNSDADILNAVKTQEVDLTVKPWPSISRHARHLVSKMLEKDPDKRIRLEQVMTHPWLRTDGTAPPRALQGGVRDRIGQFRALNIFKREARRILASVLPPEEVTGLKMLFEELDTNRDGFLTLEELREGLSRKGEELHGDEAMALLRAADLNCDGVIDYREFVAATYTLSRMQQSSSLIKAFRHFDLNGDGFITKEELAAVLSKLPPFNTPGKTASHSGRPAGSPSSLGGPGPGATPSGPGTGGLSVGFSGVAAVNVEALLAEADLNKDGRVDYREFCAMLLAEGAPLETEEGGPGKGAEPGFGGEEVTSETLLQVVQPSDLSGLVDEMQIRKDVPRGSGETSAAGSVGFASVGTVRTPPLPHPHPAATSSSASAPSTATGFVSGNTVPGSNSPRGSSPGAAAAVAIMIARTSTRTLDRSSRSYHERPPPALLSSVSGQGDAATDDAPPGLIPNVPSPTSVAAASGSRRPTATSLAAAQPPPSQSPLPSHLHPQHHPQHHPPSPFHPPTLTQQEQAQLRSTSSSFHLSDSQPALPLGSTGASGTASRSLMHQQLGMLPTGLSYLQQQQQQHQAPPPQTPTMRLSGVLPGTGASGSVQAPPASPGLRQGSPGSGWTAVPVPPAEVAGGLGGVSRASTQGLESVGLDKGEGAVKAAGGWRGASPASASTPSLPGSRRALGVASGVSGTLGYGVGEEESVRGGVRRNGLGKVSEQ